MHGLTIVYYVLWGSLTLAALVHLLLNKKEPVSTLCWIFFVFAFPILGPLIFFSFGPERLARQATKRKRKLGPGLNVLNEEGQTSFSKHSPDGSDHPIYQLAQKISEFERTDGNSTELLDDPELALKTMVGEIEKAESFIHLEYYIISSDHITERIFDSLISAKKRGVEVRILYDSLGSLFLKKIYFRKLKQNGIQISGFLPMSLLPQRFNFNFRNHRKILIIDGKLAFTGGTNIGKEYLGSFSDGQWKDFSVKLQGPVVSQIEDVFRQDWHFTTGEDLSETKYYPESKSVGSGTIQLIESGPDSQFHSLHQAIFLLINSAQKEVALMTPYFIPDSSMISALTVAALRGIKVTLILPQKSDARLVRLASRSFYDDLLEAGVQIYEFEPKILHAKVLLVDNRWTVLGSGNMDIRSFRLNFEITLLVHSPELNQQAKNLFEEDLKKSIPVKAQDFSRRSVGERLIENACRLFSPIL